MRTLIAVLLLATLSCAHPSTAQPFNQVIIFGDSNVDSGYYKALSSPGDGAPYNMLWPSAVAHGAGSPTTNPGAMSADVLAAHFGLTVKPANQTGGTNYATSGAKNVTVNSSQTGGFGAAIPTVTQINDYLMANGGVANSQAVFAIYSGDNDVSYANQDTGAGPWPADPNAYVVQAANDLATAITSLKTAGAKTIIVSNLNYSFGSDMAKRALRLTYSQTLWGLLTMNGVNFIHADHNAFLLTIQANLSHFGFLALSTAAGNMACTQPSGIISAWALLCSSDPAAPSTYITPTADLTYYCADNDCHANTAGQKLMGDFWYSMVVRSTTHDFNGDGHSDIVWKDTSGNTAMWVMAGGQVSSSGSVGAVPTAWSVVGQRDFDGDGKYDLLWRDTSGNTAMWFMNGTQVSSTAGLGNIPTTWSVVATADFNGDGKGDILWRDAGGNLAMWLMNRATVSSSAGIGNVPAAWTIVGTGDYNGDGKADLLWRDTSGNTAIWFMNGTTVTSSAGLGNIPVAWSVAGTGDFNGDGKSDILWRDTSGNTAIWFMNGAAVSSTGGLGNISSAWSVVATGDYNGDGMTDLLWRDTSGNTAMWFMNGTTVTSSAGLGNIATTWTVQSTNAE